MRSKVKISRRGGFTLVELALALVITFIALATLMRYMDFLTNQQNARALATRQVEVATASTNYLNANVGTIYTDAAGGPLAIPIARTSPGGAQPTGPDGLQSLQAAGFLPSTFIDANAYGQITYLVARQGSALNTIEAVLLTTGGRPTSDEVLGMASRYIGADGGAIMSLPPGGTGTNIEGFKGGWVAPAANFTAAGVAPTAGHVATYVVGSNNQVIGDFLWRNDIGIPEANTMHTAINMTHHDLNNVEQITGGNPANPTDDAVHMANTMVAGIADIANATDATLAGAPTEYQDPTKGGANYQYYERINGNTRLNRLDPSAIIDSTAWDPQGGADPKNYPVGMRLIDALPTINIMASYYAQDDQIVPMPLCGPPGNYNYALARIFAMPISNLDVIAPAATTQNATYYTTVPVLDSATLTEAGSTITLNTTTQNINSVTTGSAATDGNGNLENGVVSNTYVDPTGLASAYYATADTVNKDWVFHISKHSGLYSTPNNNTNAGQGSPVALPLESYDTTYITAYPNVALVQTACYYGP